MATKLVNLSQYHGKRMAVVFTVQGKTRVVKGRAQFSQVKGLGNVLRITVEGDESGQPEIVLAEQNWSGSIDPDTQYGCDFVVSFS